MLQSKYQGRTFSSNSFIFDQELFEGLIYVLSLSLSRYLCWWTINTRVYHPSVVGASTLSWLIYTLFMYY